MEACSGTAAPSMRRAYSEHCGVPGCSRQSRHPWRYPRAGYSWFQMVAAAVRGFSCLVTFSNVFSQQLLLYLVVVASSDSQILGEECEDDLSPSTVSFNIAISACDKACPNQNSQMLLFLLSVSLQEGQWQRALHLQDSQLIGFFFGDHQTMAPQGSRFCAVTEMEVVLKRRGQEIFSAIED